MEKLIQLLSQEADHNIREGKRYFDQTLERSIQISKGLAERYQEIQRRVLTGPDSANVRLALYRSRFGKAILWACGV